ncbi:MAG TPA: winged helix-turn-helix transcriptional regulator [Bacteroidales bacterium]|nr:winged helix-turn-helix transcriptional regulator [Bacteroidales bacterium]
MNKNELDIILKEGEGYKIEFKENIQNDSLKTMEETVEKTTPKTREKTREKIIRLISKNPYITTEELSEKTGLTIKGIEWNIKKLKNENLLKRIGSKKGGYWQIINNNLENHE